MSYGLEIYNENGAVIFDANDYTFRWLSDYTFTNNPIADVVLELAGVTPGQYFAISALGFAVVENGQVRIKPQFGSGSGSNFMTLFRI